MQRFLAFIPRRWRLARWQVLLGVAATVAWWLFLHGSLDHLSLSPVEQDELSKLWREGFYEDAKEYSARLSARLYAVQLSRAWFDAYLVLPAWLVFWASVIAIASARPWRGQGSCRGCRVAAMIGVAWLAAHLFSGHSGCGYYFNEYSHHREFWDCIDYPNAFSPLVFAATLVCEVAMYIAARFTLGRRSP
jgi:hypothetical protein